MSMAETLVIVLVKCVALLVLLLTGFAYMTWVERKVVARIQVRYGPNRVGPFGLMQPVADGLKLLFKEDIMPAQADRLTYILAPAISLIAALMAFAVITIGPAVNLFGREVTLNLADVNVGVLYVLAMASMGVYGIILGGWSTNNKYSFLGGLRSAAQVISYELSLGLSLVGVLLITGSLRPLDIVQAQGGYWLGFVPRWFVFLQPVGAALFMICAIADVNRAPFDLPEADTELVAGYHTDYSSIKFALFFMAEYVNMITMSALTVTLFFGGWQGPILPPALWFSLKVLVFLFCFVWLRATLPRLRYDRLMGLGWKVLLPLALANVFATALAMALKEMYF
ncbi:MAG: NADH-quinone oxidoreductase subunit NuoH [Chloroflexota bacterium]